MMHLLTPLLNGIDFLVSRFITVHDLHLNIATGNVKYNVLAVQNTVSDYIIIVVMNLKRNDMAHLCVMCVHFRHV